MDDKESKVKGQIISGEFSKIIAREKNGNELELGELLITTTRQGKILVQVVNLFYGSQVSLQNRELISGMYLEEQSDLEFMDPALRNYSLAILKGIVQIKDDKAAVCKSLPTFFSQIREVNEDDLKFLTKPKNPLMIGKLRSGSKTLDMGIFLQGDKVFSHHILIQGTTGRGKSVLVKNLIYDTVDKDYCGILVLDPHDEYYGRNGTGLKDHNESEKVIYYTPTDVPPGQRSLKINIKNVRPWHFNGVIDFSDPQKQALNFYFKQYREEWVNAVLLDKEIGANFDVSTINVVKRKIMGTLGIKVMGEDILTEGIFSDTSGESTIKDIVKDLEENKTVIVDTSGFQGTVEILIGSMIGYDIFSKYKYYKTKGELRNKPVVSIVLEEAPRVLGKEILSKGSNIFSTIAREGRKFKIGLTAITQLPSLIPREILANMNTKIILGTEMKPERQAIIDSAAQDLSDDDRTIASLDIGEAIVTSNFAKFATPVSIPFFDEEVKKVKKEDVKKDFSGIKIR